MSKNILFFILIMIVCCSCNNQETSKNPTLLSYEISPIVRKYTEEKILEDGTQIYFVMKNNENFDIDIPYIHIDFFDKNGNKVASSDIDNTFWSNTFFHRNDLTPFEGEVDLEDSSELFFNWDTSKVTIEDPFDTSSIFYPSFIENCEQKKSFAENTKKTISYPTRDFFVETKSISKIPSDYASKYEINARLTYLGDYYAKEIQPVVLLYGKNQELLGIEECFPYSNLGITLNYKESFDFSCKFDDWGNIYNYDKMEINWAVQGLNDCQYDFSKPDTLLIKMIGGLFGNVKSNELKETLIDNSESKNNLLIGAILLIISLFFCLFILLFLEKIFSVSKIIEVHDTLKIISFLLFLFLLMRILNFLRGLFYLNPV